VPENPHRPLSVAGAVSFHRVICANVFKRELDLLGLDNDRLRPFGRGVKLGLRRLRLRRSPVFNIGALSIAVVLTVEINERLETERLQFFR
jgi:hypothetical protein